MSGARRFYGPWIVLSCFFTFGIASGFPYYNIAFFFDYFRDGHGWTQQIVTFGPPLAVLLTIWAGPFIVPRFSPRWLIVAGTGLIFIAFQWFARLGPSRFEYYAAWCVYMLGYFLAGPIPHQIIISNWYKRGRGRAMGLAYVGGAVMGALGNKVSPYLVTQMPYTEALKLMGFVLLLAWPIAIFVLKDAPSDLGQHADGEEGSLTKEELTADPLPFSALTGSGPFWLLLVGSAASIGSIAAVNFLMKFVLEEQGFRDQAARNAIWSTASFISLIAAIAGRLLMGYLADRYPRQRVMLVTYVLVAVAIPMLFLVTPDHQGFVYLFGIVFGFAMGADYMLIPLMAADLFGLRTLGRAMSAILPSDTITQYWSPNLIAQLRSVWGAYASALWVACVLAAIGAVAVAFLPKSPGGASEPGGPQPPR